MVIGISFNVLKVRDFCLFSKILTLVFRSLWYCWHWWCCLSVCQILLLILTEVGGTEDGDTDEAGEAAGEEAGEAAGGTGLEESSSWCQLVDTTGEQCLRELQMFNIFFVT
jgi:hypothetical protein